MARITAVSVNDDLSACQTRITVRTADYETSRRIDKEFGLVVHQFFRQNRIKHILFDVLVNLLLRHIIVMLGR